MTLVALTSRIVELISIETEEVVFVSLLGIAVWALARAPVQGTNGDAPEATPGNGAPDAPHTSDAPSDRQMLDGLLGSIESAFCIVDASGAVLRSNDAFRSFFGDEPPATLSELTVSPRDALASLFQAEGVSSVRLPLSAEWSRRLFDTSDGAVLLSGRPLGPVPDAGSGWYAVHLRSALAPHAALAPSDVEEGRTMRTVPRPGTTEDPAPLQGTATGDAFPEPPSTEYIADVISRHALDGTCLYASPSVRRLLGYTPAEVEAMPNRSLVHPDDAARVRDAFAILQSSDTIRRRLRLHHRDGHYVWAEVTGRLRCDPDTGIPVDVIASTRDVSDRVSAERALQESELRFRQLAENVEGVFWLATRETMLYVSPALEDIWGIPRSRLYDDKATYLEGIHADDRERIAAAIDRAWNTQGVFQEEFRVRRPDGTERWVRATARPVTDTGGEVRYAGHAVDISDYKTQAEALQQSENRWRRLVETHMEPIMISIEGIIQYVNPSGAKLFGADRPEEIIGRSVLTFVYDDHVETVRDRVAQLRNGQATSPYEHRIKRLDDEFRTVVSYSVPIRHQERWAAQTVLRDVTEWREAQGKLEYRIMLENLIVDLSTSLIDKAAGVTDEHISDALGDIGPFVGADRAYLFLFDHEARTFSNTHEWVDEGIEPFIDDLQHLSFDDFPWLLDQLSTLEPLQIPDVRALPEAAARVRDILQVQSIQSLLLVPMTEGDDLIGFVGFDAVRASRSWTSETLMLLRVLGDTFSNALARKETEEALREREARYRSVVDNVRDIVFQTDATGGLTFLNPAWEALTGYSLDDTLGRPLPSFLEGEGVLYAEDTLYAPRAELNATCRCEVKLRTRDGSTRWMALFAQATEDGDAVSVVGTLHDVTERKRMETQTREALQRERELNRLKSSFASMVSHEFRTPLATIRSSAEMLEKFFDQWTPEKRHKYVQRIHTQIDRMSGLVGDVITTSKLNAKHESPDWSALDLRDFCRAAAEDVRGHIGNGRTIDVDVDDLPALVDADPDLMHHILVNLLSNAVKYSPADAPVTLQVHMDDAEGTVHLRIRDEGCGIPEADRAELFHPFYRGENSTKAEGTGLGMTIVKRAVDVYGGTLAIDSTVGEGTTVHVTLPVRS